MHHALKLAPVIAALVLAACGGGGSETPAPVTPAPPEVIAPYQATLIAGVAKPVEYSETDPKPGCVDGPALGAKLRPRTDAQAFARTPNGNLLLAEWGYCDSRYRIRVIDPVGNTIKTLAVGTLFRYADEYADHEALTTFLTPTALAAAPSGDIYIGDSDIVPYVGYPEYSAGPRSQPNRGPGIWKLGVDGNISVVAGVSLPEPYYPAYESFVDGTGAAASFKSIEGMCFGSDGLLYVNDHSAPRTVSPSGTVMTPDYLQSMATCGINGSMLFMRWWYNDLTHSYGIYDFYDPIAQRSIAQKPTTWYLKTDLNPTGLLLYFGADNPSVLIRELIPSSTSILYSGLTIVNLVDGSSTRVAWFSTRNRPVDLAAVPPVIDSAIAVVPNGSTDFDILTKQGVIRFTRKP